MSVQLPIPIQIIIIDTIDMNPILFHPFHRGQGQDLGRDQDLILITEKTQLQKSIPHTLLWRGIQGFSALRDKKLKELKS
ncbi:MAG: hypothetical protein JW855_01275 [Gammaproteobacteria bacterium]|nr:hypothetical protein [Gammaproteobacteria bacterium]